MPSFILVARCIQNNHQPIRVVVNIESRLAKIIVVPIVPIVIRDFTLTSAW